MGGEHFLCFRCAKTLGANKFCCRGCWCGMLPAFLLQCTSQHGGWHQWRQKAKRATIQTGDGVPPARVFCRLLVLDIIIIMFWLVRNHAQFLPRGRVFSSSPRTLQTYSILNKFLFSLCRYVHLCPSATVCVSTLRADWSEEESSWLVPPPTQLSQQNWEFWSCHKHFLGTRELFSCWVLFYCGGGGANDH